MRCDRALELVSGDIDGDLEPDERASLEQHLTSCEPCRRQKGELAALVSLLRAPEATAARAPAGLRARVEASLAAAVERKGGRTTTSWPA